MEVQLAGVGIILLGDFNPALFHPDWLVRNDLVPPGLGEAAGGEGLVVSHDVTQFVADWLTFQVTATRCSFSTSQLPFSEALADLAVGTFSLLSHTPVDAFGLNADSHYRLPNQAAWHAFGDRYAPKEPWASILRPEDGWQPRADDVFVAAGMRELVMEAHRSDKTGYVRVELAPSERMPQQAVGVYVGINDHYQLSSSPTQRGDGLQASLLIKEKWTTRVSSPSGSAGSCWRGLVTASPDTGSPERKGQEELSSAGRTLRSVITFPRLPGNVSTEDERNEGDRHADKRQAD